ncbi:uncharacterized protein LOC133229514 [Bos javanicus]|uniref:uncharacterized protein LOC133229514 n=1 Tax=Bos javanicus TaxID=9906 RepID=UPI002AA8751A|nr:uncharacterized protein LOC133229514 [Bos javanicus]
MSSVSVTENPVSSQAEVVSTELGTAGRRPRNSAKKATTADAQELTLKRGESPAPRGSLPARDSLPGQAQSHRTPCPSSPRAADPRKSLRDSGSGWCSYALLSRALWPAAYPASGFSPTRLLSPADSLPSGATPAGVEQRHRAEKTTKHPGVPGPGVFWLPHGLFPKPCSHPAPRPLSRAPSHLPTTLHASQRRMWHLLALGPVSSSRWATLRLHRGCFCLPVHRRLPATQCWAASTRPYLMPGILK